MDSTGLSTLAQEWRQAIIYRGETTTTPSAAFQALLANNNQHFRASAIVKKTRKVEIAVAEGTTLDHGRFLPMEETDPRAQGRWPCHQAHQPAMQAWDQVPSGTQWHRNQWASQLLCGTCGLRLGCWPVKGALAGKYSHRVHPKHVGLALDELQEDEIMPTRNIVWGSWIR